MIVEVTKRETWTDYEVTDPRLWPFEDDCRLDEFAMPFDLRTAYHEAGHAVADFALLGISSTVIVGALAASSAAGAACEGLTIPDVHANCFGDEPIESIVRLAESHAAFAPPTIEHLERLMQALMAGPIAESQASSLSLSRVWRTGGASDRRQWDKMHRALSRLRVSDRASDWRRLEAQTRCLLASNWWRVQRLTVALIANGRLTPSQVREALT